jgi:MFS family permease
VSVFPFELPGDAQLFSERRTFMAQAAAPRNPAQEVYEYSLPRVIAASSAGTMIEWYDFYIFGSLFTVLQGVFFPEANELAQTLGIFALFWVGFLVRPFGAFFFGRIGDLIGRKYTFILTISLMGGATFLIGLVPTYEAIGFFAVVIVTLLRILQGLALGGEYGGAAIYVAEHAPDDQRGYYTGYIQTTATLGLVLALVVVTIITTTIGEEALNSYGWRIPFLLSGILVVIAIYVRLKLKETPLFTRIKEAKQHSTAPIKHALEQGGWKLIVLALLGATAGQGVVWYTGQFYALAFLQTETGEIVAPNMIVMVALILATPFFLVFGRLSDRIGRKPIILAGCLLAAITYVPIYMALEAVANPLNPVLATMLVFIQVIYVTMVYGPIAAYLVELFPARVRYTSLSIPYHFGNGWFGGGTPFIISWIAGLAGGSIFVGLAYPITVALMTFIVGGLYLRETHHVRIWDEVSGAAPATADQPAKVATERA